MSGFELLHPSVQHHVVNSLGWRDLRPLQEQAVEPILAGSNCLLLSPTASGKTEAAVLPVLSAMLSRDWSGLSVLYVCPLRALLNNLEERLSFYANLVGRRCGLWHGDVTQAFKSRMLAEPPDVLLTTPESLEALLISRRTDKDFFFGNLQAVVVDEIHAFAGDDRGWHLLCVLERIGKLSRRDLQRIGLSATVGNPHRLLSWMCAASDRNSQVISPPVAGPKDADVTVDFVGDLHNAVQVLRLLHRGEKRLVFCDSRSRCEELANLLRAAEVRVFVSHSSLSAEQRREAEAAFRDARDCIIVATSTLELGIDVGDLDRVIQIDSPATVSSFLQRLGRSGRRAGSKRNCLFLTTSDESLLQAAAIVNLWRQGYLEPLEPPPRPYHVVAQQIMAIALQRSGTTRPGLNEWLGRTITEMGIDRNALDAIVAHMLSVGILTEDSGIIGIGPMGERLYGARNFMELMSVFDTPPLLKVFWGPRDLGSVHPISLRRRNDEPAILSLGGRSWQVVSVDEARSAVEVMPVQHGGRSRWLGESAPLSFRLCQEIRSILMGKGDAHEWSQRASLRIADSRTGGPPVSVDGLVLEEQQDVYAWWTFAGLNGNNTVSREIGGIRRFDNFAIWLADATRLSARLSVHQYQPERHGIEGQGLQPRVKFWECLIATTIDSLRNAREEDAEASRFVREQVVVHSQGRNTH